MSGLFFLTLTASLRAAVPQLKAFPPSESGRNKNHRHAAAEDKGPRASS